MFEPNITMVAASKNPKKQAPRRKAKGKSKRSTNVPEFASMSVNRTYSVPGGSPVPVANVMYSIMNTTLSQFNRAVQCAQAYQFYRIKNVAVKLKPQFDTYSFGGAGYGKPKLYSILDKSGALPANISLEGLKQGGARPRNLDEKALLISFAPSVLNASMTTAPGTTQPGQMKISPWLTTNANTITPGVWVPNDIDHLGVYWFVEATSYGGTGGLPYQVDVEVQFEFKGPLWTAALSEVAAISMVPAPLDNSPDGIEGGSDGITLHSMH